MRDVSILTTRTAGYVHWLLHLYRNLRLLNLHRQLRVCAADGATAAELAAEEKANEAALAALQSEIGAFQKANDALETEVLDELPICT